MEFWSMEAMEIMGDAMEEVAEWLAHEADMETHPFDWAGGLPKKKKKRRITMYEYEALNTTTNERKIIFGYTFEDALKRNDLNPNGYKYIARWYID